MPLPGRTLYYDALAATSPERDRRAAKLPHDHLASDLLFPLRSSYALGITKNEGGIFDDDAGVSQRRLYSALVAQYPAVYCEELLGIAPTPAALDIVRQERPLRPRDVKPMLRLRGAFTDEVQISPPEVQIDRRSLSQAFSSLTSRNAINQTTLLSRLAQMARQDAPKHRGSGKEPPGGVVAPVAVVRAATAAGRARVPKQRAPRPATADDLMDSLPLTKHTVSGQFGRLAAHFLYPFNLVRPDSAEAELPLRIPPTPFGGVENAAGHRSHASTSGGAHQGGNGGSTHASSTSLSVVAAPAVGPGMWTAVLEGPTPEPGPARSVSPGLSLGPSKPTPPPKLPRGVPIWSGPLSAEWPRGALFDAGISDEDAAAARRLAASSPSPLPSSLGPSPVPWEHVPYEGFGGGRPEPLEMDGVDPSGPPCPSGRLSPRSERYTPETPQLLGASPGASPGRGAPPFRVTPDGVRELQGHFVHLLREWRKEQGQAGPQRYTAAMYEQAESELTAAPTVRLAVGTLMYLHEAHLHGRDASTPVQQRRLAEIRVAWQSQSRAYRADRAHRDLTPALVVLSLRVLVVGMMSWWSARWAASPQGKEVMAAMDATLSALYDPQGYYAALAPLQASAAGVYVLQRQRRTAHMPTHPRRYDPSPLVRSLVGSAGSPSARKMLVEADARRAASCRAHEPAAVPVNAHSPALDPTGAPWLALLHAQQTPALPVPVLRAAAAALEKGDASSLVLKRSTAPSPLPWAATPSPHASTRPHSFARQQHTAPAPSPGARLLTAGSSGGLGRGPGGAPRISLTAPSGLQRGGSSADLGGPPLSPKVPARRASIINLGPTGDAMLQRNSQEFARVALRRYSRVVREEVLQMHALDRKLRSSGGPGLGLIHEFARPGSRERLPPPGYERPAYELSPGKGLPLSKTVSFGQTI